MFGLVFVHQRIDHLSEVALHDLVELVGFQVDTIVSTPPVEIVNYMAPPVCKKIEIVISKIIFPMRKIWSFTTEYAVNRS